MVQISTWSEMVPKLGVFTRRGEAGDEKNCVRRSCTMNRICAHRCLETFNLFLCSASRIKSYSVWPTECGSNLFFVLWLRIIVFWHFFHLNQEFSLWNLLPEGLFRNFQIFLWWKFIAKLTMKSRYVPQNAGLHFWQFRARKN